MAEDKIFTPDDAEWLIGRRSVAQAHAGNLYRLLKENPNLEGNIARHSQLLVATAFSLWRAVFLFDKNEATEKTSDAAIRFLGRMIQNNSILYGDDYVNRDWTFNYYATNAFYRLHEYGTEYKMPEILELLPTSGFVQPPKERWERLQTAFAIAISDFENRLASVA